MMIIPFIDLTRDEKETFINGNSLEYLIRKNIQEVINEKSFVLGEYLDKFEKTFADYCGTKYCIGVGNGFSALELSLRCLGIEKRNEVITVPNTFNATIGAILKTCAKPVLVDINEENYNVNINQIKEVINEKTKAIIPVHLYGQTVDMDKIKNIAKKYNISIIEDACQAHGAFYNGKRAGSFGVTGCFSFYPSKNLGCYGDGGAIVTNNSKINNFLRKKRNYGQTKKYFHDIIGENSRLDDIQAAILLEKLKALDKWNLMRIDNASLYRENLQNVDEIKLPNERKKEEHIYHLFVIQAEKRDELEKYLLKNKIIVGKHYLIPIHLQDCFSFLGYHKGDFPVTERISKKLLSLPMFPTIREDEIKYVSNCIKEFYSKNK